MSGLVRANTAYTMASQAWSTSELVDGLGHILTDAKNELPDSLAQLEDLLDADVSVLSIPVQFVWVKYLSYSTRTNHFWHKFVVGVHRMHIYERIKYNKLNLYIPITLELQEMEKALANMEAQQDAVWCPAIHVTYVCTIHAVQL